jgi:hypothetical protein
MPKRTLDDLLSSGALTEGQRALTRVDFNVAFWSGAALLLGGAFLSILIESQPRVSQPTASAADD